MFAALDFYNGGTFQVSDSGSGLFVHVFGAYFGLAANFALKPIRKRIERKELPGSSSLFTIGIVIRPLMKEFL